MMEGLVKIRAEFGQKCIEEIAADKGYEPVPEEEEQVP